MYEISHDKAIQNHLVIPQKKTCYGWVWAHNKLSEYTEKIASDWRKRMPPSCGAKHELI